MNLNFQQKSLIKFILLVFFLSSLAEAAPNAKIKGSVRNSSMGESLPGANVILSGTSLGAAANKDGVYSISNVSPGEYIIIATYIGYAPKQDSIIVLGENDLTHDFELDYATVKGKEVTVTAQARGQMDAINKQLSSRSIVNIVSSDRIQELPDANAAESVGRLPGVTIKREGGEGNKVVIRGLSPKYNAITINGTRLASTDANDRSADLSMISQYMLEGIEVTKAGTPDMDADVLGGTVDFQIKKAKEGFQFNLISQGMYNNLRESNDDYKFVVDASNRFFGSRLGIVGQIDIEKRNRSSNEMGASYWINGPSLEDTNIVLVDNVNLFDIVRINNRTNDLLVFDLRIPNGNISLTNLQSKIAKEQVHYRNSYGMGSNSRGFGTSDVENKIEISTKTLTYKQTISSLKLDAFLTTSSSENESPGTIRWNFAEETAFHEIDNNANPTEIPSFAKNDTLATYLVDVSMESNYNFERENSVGLNIEYEIKLFNRYPAKIKLGNKYRTKEREYDRFRHFTRLSLGSNDAIRDSIIKHHPTVQNFTPFGTQYISYKGFLNGDYDPVNFLNGNYELGPVSDVDLLNSVYSVILSNNKAETDQTASNLNDYSGEEKYRAKYIMVDINLGPKLNIIAGGRYENNTTSYSSFRADASVTPWSEWLGASYTHERNNQWWLPAFFLRLKPTDWLDIRYAQTNTLTRPNYSQIKPFWFINTTSVSWNNADLRPAQSINEDMYFSFHQNHLGLFTIGGFRKTIKDLIFNYGRRVIIDPDEYGLPEYTISRTLNNATLNNQHTVDLKGLELDWQTRFWYLPSVLSGLVLNMNYTIIESKARYPRTTIKTEYIFEPSFHIVKTNVDTFYVDRLIDQANAISNIAIGYDYKGFSSRLSMLYKSDVFKSTNFWKELRQNTGTYTRWDLSLKQDLPFLDMQIFFNLNNITSEIDQTIMRGNDFPTLEQHYGRTADLGIRFKF